MHLCTSQTYIYLLESAGSFSPSGNTQALHCKKDLSAGSSEIILLNGDFDGGILSLNENGGDYEDVPKQDHLEIVNNPIWSHALFLARRGLKIFPLKIQRKEPLFSGWPGKATSDENVVLGWAQSYSDNNYGVITGYGFFVLDFDLDVSDDLDSEIQKVQEKLGPFEVGTLVKTGRGYQLYCSTAGVDIRSNCQKRLTDKVDIKGAGGYVVGPGSIHPNGQRYEFVDLRTLEDGIKFTKLSEAALQYIVSLQGVRNAIGADDDTCLRGALDYAKPIPVGERNDTLFRIACHYRQVNGLQTNGIYAILKEINSNDCDVPLSSSELRVIAESCGRYAPGAPRSAVVEPLTNEKCREEVDNLQAATDLLSEEDQALFRENCLVDLARETIQQFHLGDTNVIALELASVVSMSIKTSNGIFPHLDGESGKGKTHATLAVLHVLPESTYFMTSFSSKALYYSDKLKPKMIIFSDDTTLNEEQEELIRKCMTNWDDETHHITIDSQRKPLTLTIPRRVTFWFTSVKNKGTLQLMNRQVAATIDDSKEQDEKVQNFIKKKEILGLPDLYETKNVLKLRRAFAHINECDFAVVVPFASQIDFKDVENRRNLKIFFDLIKVFAVMNYLGRETDCYNNIIATKQDFETARKVFKTIEKQQVAKLNKHELCVIDELRNNDMCDTEKLRKATGLPQSSLYELLHGDRNRGTEGLLGKVPEMRFLSRNDFDPATGLKLGRNHYALDKSWAEDKFSNVVSWSDAPNDYGLEVRLYRSASDHIGNDRRYRLDGAAPSILPLEGLGGGISTDNILISDISEENEELPNEGEGNSNTLDSRNSDTLQTSGATGAEKAIYHQKEDFQADISLSEAQPIGSDTADEPQDLSEIPQLIHDYLIVVKQQQQGKKLRPDLLRSMVGNKVRDLSDGKFSVPTVLEYYDRLNGTDAKITALISSICGGEPLVRGSNGEAGVYQHEVGDASK
jgi:hypothetical protein